jgi:hypothetical protein
VAILAADGFQNGEDRRPAMLVDGSASHPYRTKLTLRKLQSWLGKLSGLNWVFSPIASASLH